MSGMNDSILTEDDWRDIDHLLAADRAATDEVDRAYRAYLDAAPEADPRERYICDLEDALARRTLECSEAAERALAWEWAYREERLRARQAARWGTRWRDVALLALGAGSLVAGRLRGER